MVKVAFEAENIADLKLMIQEYSLTHLGLNFKEMAGKILKHGGGKPGVTDSVELSDGSKRLHNPSYPSKMKAPIEEPKRGRGRPVGWRKPEVTELSKSEVIEKIGELKLHIETAPAYPDAGYTPSKEAAKTAIHELNKVKGFAVAMEALAKFGAKHLNEIMPEKYPDLIKYCEELTNGGVNGNTN